MGRREIRKAKRFARMKGIDLDNPNFDVVMAPYKTGFVKVVTEQSSYIIDIKGHRALRIPGDEASHLNEDSTWYDYETIFSCSVSFPLRMTWYNNDRLIMRETTPIKEVIDLTEEEVMQIANSALA